MFHLNLADSFENAVTAHSGHHDIQANQLEQDARLIKQVTIIHCRVQYGLTVFFRKQKSSEAGYQSGILDKNLIRSR
jgi:hypothetical protein